MRKTESNNGLKVHAIGGTYVTLFGFHLPQSVCDGLLGFSLHRFDHTENEAYFLKATKAFSETDPGLPPGSLYSTRDHPIQSFQWSDYTAKPGHDYTYTITALKGEPADLQPFASTSVRLSTEAPESGAHDIYFNRGVAASQAYERRFGDRRPKDVPNRAAYEWLSRGLNEALEEFIGSCQPGRHALRIAAYEFNYDRFLTLIKDTVDAGVDIQVIYDARRDHPKDSNRQAVAAIGLDAVCKERTHPKSYISHNKFIVKLDNGQPTSIWTGGTNFSEGGIFGHSNVAHVVEDPVVAQSFLDYWNALAAEPEPGSGPLKDSVEALTPLPAGQPPSGTSILFSPRRSLDALNWYANLAKSAQEGLLMTFAFGMNDIFKEVYRTGTAPFRMALMEKITRSMRAGPERDAEEQSIWDLRRMPENTFAIGGLVKTNEIDGWVKEHLSNLNSHVRFVHNKFMLIDPLSDDPIVVGGSANFSDASTRRNDENMLIVRGNTRVADIYLGEFVRLYSHHAFREFLSRPGPTPDPKPLRTDDWWTDYFGDTVRSTRRRFFARVEE